MSNHNVKDGTLQGDGPVHLWFGLSYANYMTLPRSLLQSMPYEWQEKFIDMVNELEDAYAHLKYPMRYMVTARNEHGMFIKDPVPHYNRGRTYVEPKLNEK